jgi:phosphatidylinositol-3-phosphatase
MMLVPSATGATQPRATRIALIVMENTEYGSVIGSGEAPFVNRLARTYGLATDFYGTAHPSLPNYLALLGGATFGIDDNCDDCRVAASSLVDQLEPAHITWKAYMEGVPSPCYTGGESGNYTKHHNPFAYFSGIAERPSRCNRVVALEQLGADIAAGRLPQFVWITPDECHDMHDCGVSAGDRFLAGIIPNLLRALGPSGLLFLTWDEGTSDEGCCVFAHGGHIATVLAGRRVRRGSRFSRPADHYSILRTIEDVWRLPHLRNAGCTCSPALTPLLSRSR